MLKNRVVPDAATAKAVRKYVKQGFEYSGTLSGHISHTVTAWLRPLNKMCETHGVESLYPEAPHIYYLNTGDTYAATLVFNDVTCNLFVSDLGTIVENARKRPRKQPW
jgi:hypothetical protein